MKLTNRNEIGDTLKPLKSIHEKPRITEESEKDNSIRDEDNKSRNTRESLQS